MIELFRQCADDRVLVRRVFFGTITSYLIVLMATIVLLPLATNQSNTLVGDAVAAFSYVAVIVVIAGLTGQLELWRLGEPLLPKRPFLWGVMKISMWLPAVIVLFISGSVTGIIIAGTVTVFIAKTLRRLREPLAKDRVALSHCRNDIFSVELAASSNPETNRVGLTLMACSIYCGFLGWADDATLAVLFIAASCLYFGWSHGAYVQPGKHSHEVSLPRVFFHALLAVAVTFIGLLPRSIRSLGPRSSVAVNQRQDNVGNDTLHSVVILLPIRKTSRTFVLPQMSTPRKVRRQVTKTAVILFSGEYWFSRRPMDHLPPGAFKEQGDPTHVEVTLENDGPLVGTLFMQARQTIEKPVDIHCCRSINLFLNDKEGDPVAVSVELVLMNSSGAEGKEQTLGVQPLPASPTGPTHSSMIRFALPRHAAIRSFNQIVVWFRLKGAHRNRAAAVSIERFELQP